MEGDEGCRGDREWRGHGREWVRNGREGVDGRLLSGEREGRGGGG